MKKRILYLINHTSLIDSECNILKELGFEIYLPKKINNQRSFSILYDFDETLTFPENILLYLNSINFYEDTFTEKLINCINEYFDIIIIPNIYPLALNIVKFFKGHIILRAFGYQGKYNIEKVTSMCCKKIKGINKFLKPKNVIHWNEMTQAISQCKKQFTLGVAYENIIENETPFFKELATFLPIGIGKNIWKLENTWQGHTNKIMFVCPSIETEYYGQIYREFKNDFGDFPHTIFGFNTPNEKNNIVGFLDRKDFDKALQNYKVMFYHSREPRHLHYHPLEAIIVGMPLIYMSGGMLDFLSNEFCEGCCTNIYEAKEKIQRILDGDEKFIHKVISTQNKLLKNFDDEQIKKYWILFFKEKGLL